MPNDAIEFHESSCDLLFLGTLFNMLPIVIYLVLISLLVIANVNFFIKFASYFCKKNASRLLKSTERC